MSQYNLTSQYDIDKLVEKVKFHISKGHTVELIKKAEIRTMPQNRYIHVLFCVFGLETGYTKEEVKQEIFKKIVNTDLFYDGESEGPVTIQKWRSTSSLSIEEMSIAIERFRNFASREFGIYLMDKNDLMAIREAEREINKPQSKILLGV